MIPIHHADHALLEEHAAIARQVCAAHADFFAVTVDIDTPLPCALYGPLMGDPPVSDWDVYYAPRGNRSGASRMIAKPWRLTKRMTVIGIGGERILTAYGGEMAPREPFDPSMSDEEHAESCNFWSQHALADGSWPRSR